MSLAPPATVELLSLTKLPLRKLGGSIVEALALLKSAKIGCLASSVGRASVTILADWARVQSPAGAGVKIIDFPHMTLLLGKEGVYE